MVMQYMHLAMGNGNIADSTIFQSSFDWIFQRMFIEGKHLDHEEFESLSARGVSDIWLPPYNPGAYELLHDFMVNESVVLTVPVENGYPDQVEEQEFGFSEALADQVAHTTWLWIKSLSGLSGAEDQALKGFSKFLTAGMLTELFKLPLEGGTFESEAAKRCTGPLMQTRFQVVFGTRKALQWFPKSSERGHWLEDDLGM